MRSEIFFTSHFFVKSKMVDGRVSAFDSNASLTDLPEKKSGYTFGQNETLLLFSLYQKYEAYFSDVSYKKKAIWQMIADDMKKGGYSPSARKSVRTGGSALLLRFESAKTITRVGEATIFVTQCLLLPDLLRNVYSCQDHASRRAFFYAGNPNYSEHSVPIILIPE